MDDELLARVLTALAPSLPKAFDERAARAVWSAVVLGSLGGKVSLGHLAHDVGHEGRPLPWDILSWWGLTDAERLGYELGAEAIRGAVPKPSDVVLRPVPFVGLLGRAEREVAAAYLVRACQFHGDRWQAITLEQVKTAVRDDVQAGREPMTSMTTNPFYRPSFTELIELGYALRVGDGYALTPAFFEAISRDIRPRTER